ncbi:MAG: sugar phosphate isomerase/epimerase, partial [Chlamydiia bacterium]|nr:sugar phosphate isomerase/epimerase [Chlamydiia bacterium]
QHGETEIQRKSRFDKWYLDQVKKMKKADIIGHVHVVDTLGYADQHLPIGEGSMPVKTALEYLKEKGYTGTMMSEAHGMGKGGQARQMLKTWAHLGSTVSMGNVYGGGGAPGAGRVSFGDVHQSYFGSHRAPYTIFGAYAPSNDWTLWTQVPLE